jgi:GNAT superfamily N-acetyltransferase
MIKPSFASRDKGAGAFPGGGSVTGPLRPFARRVRPPGAAGAPIRMNTFQGKRKLPGVTDELDGIRIQRATPEDAFVLAAMTLRWDLEGGAPRRDGFIDEFAEAWLSQGSARPAWLARRADGDPVGFAIGILATSLPSLRRPTGGWVHLSSMYVAPDLRGRGLGERLLRHIIDWAAESGLYRLQLNATDQARSLYRRVGFTGPQDTLMQCVLTDRLPTT